MKVCIYTETFHPVVGGGETQARLLAEGLLAQGIEVCVLTRRSDAALAAEERLGDLRVHRVGPGGAGQLKKWRLALAGVPALLRLRHDYDLLFVSGFRIVGAPAVSIARRLGKHVVLKADSAGEMSGDFFAPGLARVGWTPRTPPFRALLALRNRVLRRADAVVAITDDIAAEFRSAGIPIDRQHRIPNAVDTRRFAPASTDERRELRRRLGLPEAARIVAYTGRLVSYKGLPRLLEIWPRILDNRPDACLVLVGNGGLDIHNCEPSLRATVREQGLGHRVVFTGSVANVEDYLRAADAFAFPTENDAFPSSVIEAMACALPVVATPVGALPEILRNGEAGLLVGVGDASALQRAIERVLLDDEFAARLGRKGWQVVQERYSARTVTARYVELFRRLLGRPQPAAPQVPS